MTVARDDVMTAAEVDEDEDDNRHTTDAPHLYSRYDIQHSKLQYRLTRDNSLP